MATKPSLSPDALAADQDVETTLLLDVQSAAVKRLLAQGKERGYITFDDLNAALPLDQISSEQIEDVMAHLSEMGIQVVESEDGNRERILKLSVRSSLDPDIEDLDLMLAES